MFHFFVFNYMCKAAITLRPSSLQTPVVPGFPLFSHSPLSAAFPPTLSCLGRTFPVLTPTHTACVLLSAEALHELQQTTPSQYVSQGGTVHLHIPFPLTEGPMAFYAICLVRATMHRRPLKITAEIPKLRFCQTHGKSSVVLPFAFYCCFS